jgi:hypothetical protein
MEATALAFSGFNCTTMSDHDQPVAGNVLDRQFRAGAPNQRWVGDTTETRGSRQPKMLCIMCKLRISVACSSWDEHASQPIDQSPNGLSRCVAVYLPTLLPTAVPTSVLLRQCIPPHTRALPSSAWISLTLL